MSHEPITVGLSIEFSARGVTPAYRDAHLVLFWVLNQPSFHILASEVSEHSFPYFSV